MATWLVAPDSFKGTISAQRVAELIADGLRGAGADVDVCPVADGGEGTMRMLLDALGGTTVTTRARDPLGREIEARYALLDDGCTAIVESAEASGLGLVDPSERDAEAACSTGTGDLIVAAARAGAERILIAVGGSACTDGGAGALDAIRAAGGLGRAQLEVVCDTTAPFERAALIFGPQKGADEATVARLSERLTAVARTFPRDPRGLPMGGCAGGLSGGLWACLGARLRPGADVVLDAVAFDTRAATAGNVVTGEGRLDEQTLDGKLVSVVARRARGVGAQAHAIVGRCQLAPVDTAKIGLTDVVEASTEAELRQAGTSVERRRAASVDAMPGVQTFA